MFPTLVGRVLLNVLRAACRSFRPERGWAPFTALPIQTFSGVSHPQSERLQNPAAAITGLPVRLHSRNAVAIWLRDRCQKRMAA